MTSPQTTALPPSASPLRLWRTKRHLTLIQAAEMLGTTEATLSRIETGANPPSRELEDRIVNITHLSRDDIAEPRLARQARNNPAPSAEAGAP